MEDCNRKMRSDRSSTKIYECIRMNNAKLEEEEREREGEVVSPSKILNFQVNSEKLASNYE